MNKSQHGCRNNYQYVGKRWNLWKYWSVWFKIPLSETFHFLRPSLLPSVRTCKMRVQISERIIGKNLYCALTDIYANPCRKTYAQYVCFLCVECIRIYWRDQTNQGWPKITINTFHTSNSSMVKLVSSTITIFIKLLIIKHDILFKIIVIYIAYLIFIYVFL